VEVCADSVDSALIAQAAGAERIEFCNSLAEGGITPSGAQIAAVRQLLTIKLYVLIRPRGGDFLYNTREVDIMLADIRACGEAGCNGVVIGLLNADGSIDTARCTRLVDAARAYGMGLTFHRAFDRCRDLREGLEAVVSLGCERILTSGGRTTAEEGATVIRELVQQAAGRISIMPGAGITPENAEALLRTTGAKELHGTFSSCYPSGMRYRNTGLPHQEEEYSRRRADGQKIQAVIQLANNFTHYTLL
jgi:copper homeostasis protein